MVLITVNGIELRACVSIRGSRANARRRKPRVWRHNCWTARTATFLDRRSDGLRRPT